MKRWPYPFGSNGKPQAAFPPSYAVPQSTSALNAPDRTVAELPPTFPAPPWNVTATAQTAAT